MIKAQNEARSHALNHSSVDSLFHKLSWKHYLKSKRQIQKKKNKKKKRNTAIALKIKIPAKPHHRKSLRHAPKSGSQVFKRSGSRISHV